MSAQPLRILGCSWWWETGGRRGFAWSKRVTYFLKFVAPGNSQTNPCARPAPRVDAVWMQRTTPQKLLESRPLATTAQPRFWAFRGITDAPIRSYLPRGRLRGGGEVEGARQPLRKVHRCRESQKRKQRVEGGHRDRGNTHSVVGTKTYIILRINFTPWHYIGSAHHFSREKILAEMNTRRSPTLSPRKTSAMCAECSSMRRRVPRTCHPCGAHITPSQPDRNAQPRSDTLQGSGFTMEKVTPHQTSNGIALRQHIPR